MPPGLGSAHSRRPGVEGHRHEWSLLHKRNEEASGVPRIPYPTGAVLEDPEVRAILELAQRRGTPRPESQAIRAHNPAVLRAFTEAWESTFHGGVLDHTVKELCRVYVSQSIDCAY